MAGLVPAIHAFFSSDGGRVGYVDGRIESGHDDCGIPKVAAELRFRGYCVASLGKTICTNLVSPASGCCRVWFPPVRNGLDVPFKAAGPLAAARIP